MKTHTYLTTVLFTVLVSASLPVGAWGFGPIQPGDHVFDMKRFQDSVKETAEMVKTYTQEIDKWKKKILLMTGVTGLDKRIDTAIRKFEAQWHGQSVVSPGNTLESTAMRQPLSNEYLANQFIDYRSLLLHEQQNANLDALSTTQGILNRFGNRYQDMLSITAIETPGEVGEIQKNTAISALQVLNTEDRIRLSATEALQKITAEDAAAANDMAEIRAASLRGSPAYDPYHPTESDKVHAPAVEDFGFLSTKKTE